MGKNVPKQGKKQVKIYGLCEFPLKSEIGQNPTFGAKIGKNEAPVEFPVKNATPGANLSSLARNFGFYVF